MKFNKKIRVGVSILCLLLIFTTSLSLIDFDKTINVLDENSPSISASEDNYETRDGYANNNEIYNATDITFLNGTWLSLLDGNGTQLDSDFYMIYISRGYEHLKVNVTFTDFLGDINVRILDEYGALWNIGSVVLSGEYVDWFAPWDGTYYIEIFGVNSGNTYDLIWTTHPVDDIYEPNDNWDSAFDISGHNNTLLFGRQFDDDWYNFTVDIEDERLIIDLIFNHLEGDIDITLYDNSITGVAWGTSVDDNEYINYVLPEISVNTTYYIQIYYDNQGNDYELKFDIVPFDDPFDYPFGGNDDWINATDLSDPSEEGIWHWDLISADDDWYKVNVSWDEKRLNVEVDHDNAHGYISFDIYWYNGIDPYDNWIAGTDDVWIDITVPWDGEYYIHIYGDFSGNQYNLRWEDNPVYDDQYEENDYEWEAYDLQWWEAAWLPFGLGVQLDDDWYQV